MDERQAVQLIYDGLVGRESIPVKLRMHRGLDREQFGEVKKAIQFLTECWHGRDVVPKRLAAAFVDLGSSMEWARDLYSEAEQDAIEDAANELIDLAYDLFEVSPSERSDTE